MPSTMAAALSVTLAICLPFVTAQAAAPDPRVDQVDRVISLTKALVKGVEQCFNPSHTKGNTATKNRLTLPWHFKLECALPSLNHAIGNCSFSAARHRRRPRPLA